MSSSSKRRRNQPRNTSTANLRNRPPPRQPAQQPIPRPIQPPPIETYGINFGNNEQYMANFLKIRHRSIVPTRFKNGEATLALGIEDEMLRLFTRAGWAPFLSKHAYTYTNLTFEFLSTMTVERKSNGYTPKEIAFNCLGKRYYLTVSHVNQILGLPRHGQLTRPNLFKIEGYSDKAFWRDLTGLEQYDPSRSKATCIFHYVLRYIVRLLSCTLFARNSTGGVCSAKELYFLWHIVVNSARDVQGDEDVFERTLNPGAWFIDYLYNVAEGSGEIAIGGMLTLLVKGATNNLLDFSVFEPYKVGGTTTLDLQSLKTMNWIKKHDQGHVWLVGRPNLPRPVPYATLPREGLPQIEGRETWIFPPNFVFPNAEGVLLPVGGDHQHMEEDIHILVDGSQPFQEAQAYQDAQRPQGDNQSPTLEEQITGLRTDFGHMSASIDGLRREFADTRTGYENLVKSHDRMATTFGEMKSQFDSMQSAFQSMCRHFEGGFNSTPRINGANFKIL